jgi:hypothetical protein
MKNETLKRSNERRNQMRKKWALKAHYEYPFGITMANMAIINYINYLEDELEQLKNLECPSCGSKNIKSEQEYDYCNDCRRMFNGHTSTAKRK